MLWRCHYISKENGVISYTVRYLIYMYWSGITLHTMQQWFNINIRYTYFYFLRNRQGYTYYYFLRNWRGWRWRLQGAWQWWCRWWGIAGRLGTGWHPAHFSSRCLGPYNEHQFTVHLDYLFAENLTRTNIAE